MAFILVGFFILVSGVIYIAIYHFLHPRRQPKQAIPEDYGVKYEDVTFQAEDAFELRGWFIPAANPTDKVIIICHGYRGNKTHTLEWGLFLRDKYNLFYFDFRTHGKSQGKVTTFGYHERKDVEAAICYLRTRSGIDHNQIGVMGLSMGARTALLSSIKNQEIKAIVADSTPLDFEGIIKVFRNYYFIKWPLIKLARFYSNKFLHFSLDEMSLKRKAKKIKIPVLMIHAKNDPVVHAYNSQMVYQNLGGPKELWMTDCFEHGRSYFSFKRDYQEKVLQFFGRYIR
ncbi:MAG: alpha/beta fold hydrolase [Patescibacteria group bacterium]